MNRLVAVAVLLFGLSLNANADIWKWTDAHGKIHFVNTLKPIYTWVEGGKVFFADKPGHEDAVSVELVWHSTGSDAEEAAKDADFAKILASQQQFRGNYKYWKSLAYLPRDFDE